MRLRINPTNFMYRSHTCSELNASHVGQSVTLAGWVHRRRDHGGLIFIDLRDRYGLTQVVIDPSQEAVHGMAEDVRSEYVLQVTGNVRKRPEGSENKNMSTGEIELVVSEMKILNAAKTTPFEIDVPQDPNEELRLKYRYLDLRRERMKNNIVVRHKIVKSIRDYMDKHDFVEIETPILIKGTPEGSREYIVPSRLYHGKFFVLPQSPQQMKQLLMVAGMDRYFQIARCFRDEDQRGDRQPEFTQLDVEMSFVDAEDVMSLNEGLMIELVENYVPYKKLLKKPFPRLTWKDAMSRYGSDKPDLRFGMEICDVSSLVAGCGFKVFADAVAHEGVVFALRVPGASGFTRKQIDDLTELAKVYGAKGLAYIVMEEGGVKSPIAKFFSEDEMKKLVEATGAQTGDIVFFGADEFDVAATALGQVRLACGDTLGLRKSDELAFCWIYEFPLFEYSKEDKRLVSAHHPFTAPMAEDVAMLDTNPRAVRAKAYDLALNGSEIGGGSIRIHDAVEQGKIFEVLGISKEDCELRFGHMLHAFEYGAPPHGGIAWGIDRLVMIFRDEPNIREVMAFPKDSKAKDLMMGSPSELPKEQIDEMHIEIAKEDM